MAVIPTLKNGNHITATRGSESETEPVKPLKHSGKQGTRVTTDLHDKYNQHHAGGAQQTRTKGGGPPTTSTFALTAPVHLPKTRTTPKLRPSVKSSISMMHGIPITIPRTRFHPQPTMKAPASKTQTLSSSAIIGIAVGSLSAFLGIYLVIRWIRALQRRKMRGFLRIPESGYVDDKHDTAGHESPLFGTSGHLSPERPADFTWSWIAYPQGNNVVKTEVDYPYTHGGGDLDTKLALQPIQMAVTRATNRMSTFILPRLEWPYEEAKTTHAADGFEFRKRTSKDSYTCGGCRRLSRTSLGSAGDDMVIELPLFRRDHYTRGRIQAPYYMVGSYPRLSATRVRVGARGSTRDRLSPTMFRCETERPIEQTGRTQRYGLGLTPNREAVAGSQQQHGQKVGRVSNVFAGGSDQDDYISYQHRRLGTTPDGRIAADTSSNDISAADVESAGATSGTDVWNPFFAGRAHVYKKPSASTSSNKEVVDSGRDDLTHPPFAFGASDGTREWARQSQTTFRY